MYLLCAALVRSLVLVVDAAEVGHDDRDGKCNDQDTAEGADRAEDLTRDRFRNHVSVPTEEARERLNQSVKMKIHIPCLFV